MSFFPQNSSQHDKNSVDDNHRNSFLRRFFSFEKESKEERHCIVYSETDTLNKKNSESHHQPFSYGGMWYTPVKNNSNASSSTTTATMMTSPNSVCSCDSIRNTNGWDDQTTKNCEKGNRRPTWEEASTFSGMSSGESGASENGGEAMTQEEETSSIVDPFELRGKLSVGPLAVIIFYAVSGGTFGVEEAVRSAGNFYTLLGFLIMPFIWSIQEALMTAELGSAFPEASGGVAWVTEAFGNRSGFMSGYLSWVSGATDNAIYPVLFVEYLLQLFGAGDDGGLPQVWKFFLFTAMSCALAYTNWLGLPLVGQMSTTICFLAMSPFIILSIIGAFQVDPARWFMLPELSPALAENNPGSVGLFSLAALSSVAWRPFLNNMFWNLNSFDSASAFSADVENPGRVLPRALGWAVLMVWSCYFVPLLVALGSSSAKQSDWVDGYFSVVAKDLAGPWLGGWLVFAAGISNIAMFQAELSSDAFKLMGMAERGYLPKIFATRSVHGTPTYGILLGTFVIVCMTVTDLDDLIEMLNFNYALALIMEYFAFIKLRISRPDIERPYRIPLNTTACIVLFTPTILAVFAVVLLASVKTWLFSVAVNIVGLFLYWMRERQLEAYGSVERQVANSTEVEFPDVEGKLP